jgi:hypothetical protein
LLGYGLGWELEEVVGHDVSDWSFALERRFLK